MLGVIYSGGYLHMIKRQIPRSPEGSNIVETEVAKTHCNNSVKKTKQRGLTIAIC